MQPDPALFFVNLFLLFYESKWLKTIKNTNYEVARILGNTFRFIDDFSKMMKMNLKIITMKSTHAN